MELKSLLHHVNNGLAGTPPEPDDYPVGPGRWQTIKPELRHYDDQHEFKFGGVFSRGGRRRRGEENEENEMR